MDIVRFLQEICRIPGTPGFERPVGDYLCGKFAACAQQVDVDRMGNVIATVGSGRVRVMVAAHQDEIGLAVTMIEDDGCIRFTENGGVDPRILPGQEVKIMTGASNGRDGLFGVIGIRDFAAEHGKPQAVKPEELFIDTGLDAEELRAQVRIGDPVVLLSEPEELLYDVLSGKTMDDRASIAAMLVAAEELSGRNANAQVSFVSTTQEEIGSRGAQTAAYTINPDFAIAIDVTHAKCPDMQKWQGCAMDKTAIGSGPYLHPVLVRAAVKAAEKYRIPYEMENVTDDTWTDADCIRCVRGGIPTLLISIPLRYMHTTVETLSTQVIRDAGLLMAEIILDISRSWEEIKWF